VYIDGRYAGRVRLRSASTQARIVVFARAWSTAGRHTIAIHVLGTGRVDIDGFVVLS
jgi:hypothetical protein